MNLKVGDKVVYRPTVENGGVLHWDGVTAIIIAFNEEEDHERWGKSITLEVDPEFYLKRIPSRTFQTYDQRVSKLNQYIIWEV